MSKKSIVFNLLLISAIGCLGFNNYKIKKQIMENRATMVSNAVMITDTQFFLKSFIEMAPEEMENIARDVANEVADRHAREKVKEAFKIFIEGFKDGELTEKIQDDESEN